MTKLRIFSRKVIPKLRKKNNKHQTTNYKQKTQTYVLIQIGSAIGNGIGNGIAIKVVKYLIACHWITSYVTSVCTVLDSDCIVIRIGVGVGVGATVGLAIVVVTIIAIVTSFTIYLIHCTSSFTICKRLYLIKKVQ